MKSYYIQDLEGNVYAKCNEYSIETEKRKLKPGTYMVIGPSCEYKIVIDGR